MTSPAGLPQRLAAPGPGWSDYADVVVVGSGIAGLTAALRVKDVLAARGEGGTVMVVTKDILSAGSTRWAQGGIAAALGPGDTPAQHMHDTLVAGAGICDRAAVRALVTEGPDAVRELIALGTMFDHTDAGVLSLTREGGHHRDRIAHAGGDATGAEIQRALVAAIHGAPEIRVVEHALAVDLIPGAEGSVAGVTLHVMGEGQHDGVGAVLCRAVVLASGGLGQVFSQTTNPAVSTGDGMAVALRAGAVLRDLEFVQFHPTVMWLGPDSHGQQPLISEAVRGEGAFLVDWDGVRFMQGQHDLADLAPRDVVAKAITRRMHETGKPHMWLDARHLGLPTDEAAKAVGASFGDRAAREESACSGVRAGSEESACSGVRAGSEESACSGVRAGSEESACSGVRAGSEESACSGVRAGSEESACSGVRAASEESACSGVRAGSEERVCSGDRAASEERVCSGDRAASEASACSGDRAASEASASRFWERRFPTILATCRSHGVDPVTELIPVAPACHYASGGVATDLDGQSSLTGLYATGEVACSGVHGANRLASNSLLEGLVFSRRIATAFAERGLPVRQEPVPDERVSGLLDDAVLSESQAVMTEQVGVLRSADGITDALGRLAVLAGKTERDPRTKAWQVTNLVTVSTALAAAARLREETRGSHWREDFPDRDDADWAGHVEVTMQQGELHLVFGPSTPTDGGTS